MYLAMAKIPRTIASARNDMNAIMTECVWRVDYKRLKSRNDMRWGSTEPNDSNKEEVQVDVEVVGLNDT